MAEYRIPFNRPACLADEQDRVGRALAFPHWSGDGPATKHCSEVLESTLGIGKALMTTSCTHALELTALLLDLKPGDEVIVPSFTFVSTANAFLLHGARPVFVDVTEETLNLDPAGVEAAVTERTRAIVPVHYAGIGCDMDALGAIAERHHLIVIEDNAHGLFGRRGGRWLGSFGNAATLSFHETKNFSCGEGGALLLNDPAWMERAEILREKGTNRSRFFRGQVDKYSWVDTGSSYLLSDLLAAVLSAQLDAWTSIQQRRQAVWQRYHEILSPWAPEAGLRLPVVPPDCDPAWHMYQVLLPDLDTRTRVIQHLKSRGILAVFHYLPLHLSDMGRRLGGQPGDCPVTESVSDRLLRLPFYPTLTEAEQEEVCRELRQALGGG